MDHRSPIRQGIYYTCMHTYIHKYIPGTCIDAVHHIFGRWRKYIKRPEGAVFDQCYSLFLEEI